MAERHSTLCLQGTEIITDFGSIQQTRTESPMRVMAAQPFPQMAAKTGPLKTTSRLRNFITWPWTMRSPTTFTARNRTIPPCASPVAKKLRVGELVQFRELLYFLTWRDIKVRYKQTALGATWDTGLVRELASALGAEAAPVSSGS